jgi:hypothetical protein
MEELIEMFSVSNPLSLSNTPPTISNVYYLPSPTTTGDDYYLLNKVLVYDNFIVDGVSTDVDPSGKEIIDLMLHLLQMAVQVGDVVALVSGGITQYVTVTFVNSETSLYTTASIVTQTPFNSIGIDYNIYRDSLEEAEKVSHSKITMLNNSLLTKPNLTYPAYTQEGIILTAFPSTVNKVGQVLSQYIRYPKDPKWTYITLVSGEPAFSQSQPDYQDFELPLDCEPDLVNKILQYAGMSIRELSAVQFGQGLEQIDNQSQQ